MKRRVITLCHQKGGVGKTATAALIAHKFPKPLLLIDCDPQSNLTNWTLGLLPTEKRKEAAAKLQRFNTFTMLQGKTSINSSKIQITENLYIVGSTVELERSRIEFNTLDGAEFTLRSEIDEYEGQETIILDTAGELSLLSIMALSAADTALIPCGTQVLPIDSLPITLQRIGQVQERLNPKLGSTIILPTLYNRTRRTNRVSLDRLAENYSALVAKYHDGLPVVIDDRADVENLLHAHIPLPKRAQACAAITGLCEWLEL
jgi:chromosome partitioning protein